MESPPVTAMLCASTQIAKFAFSAECRWLTKPSTLHVWMDSMSGVASARIASAVSFRYATFLPTLSDTKILTNMEPGERSAPTAERGSQPPREHDGRPIDTGTP